VSGYRECHDAEVLAWCKANGIRVEVGCECHGWRVSQNDGADAFTAGLVKFDYRLRLPSSPVPCDNPTVLAWWAANVDGGVEEVNAAGVVCSTVVTGEPGFRALLNSPTDRTYCLVGVPDPEPQDAPSEVSGVLPQRPDPVTTEERVALLDGMCATYRVRELVGGWLSAAEDTITELRATVADRDWSIEVRDERIKLLDEEVEMADHASTKLTAQVAAQDEALSEARARITELEAERDEAKGPTPAECAAHLRAGGDVLRLNGFLNEWQVDFTMLDEWEAAHDQHGPRPGYALRPLTEPEEPATEDVPLLNEDGTPNVVGRTLPGEPGERGAIAFLQWSDGRSWKWDINHGGGYMWRPLPVNSDGTVTVLAADSPKEKKP